MRRALPVLFVLLLSACDGAVSDYAHLFGLGVDPDITTTRVLDLYGEAFDQVALLIDLTNDDDRIERLEDLNRQFKDDSAVLEISFYGPCCGGGPAIDSAYSFRAEDFGLLQKSCSGAHRPDQDELWRCKWRSNDGQTWDVLKYTRYEKVNDATWVLAAEFEYSALLARLGRWASGFPR